MITMAFYATQDAFLDRTQTVTRRFECPDMNPGDVVQAVDTMLKNQRVLGKIEIVSVLKEPASMICNYPNSLEELVKEGFINMDPPEFVDWLCRGYGKKPSDIVNRIEFEYVDDATQPAAAQ